MESEVSEVLSAFLDGEAFEPSELAAALAEPGARDALVDFVLLRRALDDGGEPSAAFVDSMRARLRWGPRRRGLQLMAAAAVIVLAVLGALNLGGIARPVQEGEAPPEPVRELHFEPGVDWQPSARR
jgi:negative regulator of sigma E activity